MGGIDLDPASCLEANETVRATHIYTRETNGLTRPWYGNVYHNPPYGTALEKPEWSQAEFSFGRFSVKEIWVEKFLMEWRSGRVDQAILVLTASVGDAWFHRLVVPTADRLCFPRRIPFKRPGGNNGKPNGQPGASVVAYYGPNSWNFAMELSVIGWVAIEWVQRVP